jgi:hypothetical protein
LSDIEGTIYDITKGVRAIGEHGTKNVGDIGKSPFWFVFWRTSDAKKDIKKGRGAN